MNPKTNTDKVEIKEESLCAMYRVKSGPKETFEKTKHAITRPTKPLVKPTFYEPHWTSQKLLKQSLFEGKIV